MPYFTQDYIQFFKELSVNNHKEWFHAQKKRYESQLKKPFARFVDDLIEAINTEGEQLELSAKDCILRINRDIRFSKDKSPYHLHQTAFVSKTGRKDKGHPGIFIRFAPDMVGIMGGRYSVEKSSLQALRKKIQQNPAQFKSLIEEPEFQQRFGGIQGEQHKRLPAEFKETAEQIPLIANKQFYFMAQRETDLLLSENLLDEIMSYWRCMRPLNDFLTQL